MSTNVGELKVPWDPGLFDEPRICTWLLVWIPSASNTMMHYHSTVNRMACGVEQRSSSNWSIYSRSPASFAMRGGSRGVLRHEPLHTLTIDFVLGCPGRRKDLTPSRSTHANQRSVSVRRPERKPGKAMTGLWQSGKS